MSESWPSRSSSAPPDQLLDEGLDLLAVDGIARARRARPGSAAVLGVNTNTVLRALRLLRDEGCSSFGADAASPLQGRPNGALSSSEREKIIEGVG